MQAAHTAQVAFYLTGQQRDDATATGLGAISGLSLVPALVGHYRDLTSLRYDFPLLLLSGKKDAGAVISLSAAVDAAVAGFAGKPEADRIRANAHRLEREIRRLLTEGNCGTLRALLVKAAGRVDTLNDKEMADSVKKLGAILPNDAEVVDCNAAMPNFLVVHMWAAAQSQRLVRTRADIARLIQKVSDILGAARVRTDAGRSPEALRASVGTMHSQVFDFSAFSRVLARGTPAATLPEARWQRLRWLLSVLQSQRFVPPASAKSADIAPTYDCVFSSCAEARDAWAERLPKAIELAKAMAMAELEVANEYDEARHDQVFAAFGARGLDTADAARFPAMLVRVNAAQMGAADAALAIEMLDAGLPLKLLVQNDDILAPSSLGDGACGLGLANRQMVSAAIGLGNVFVLQAPAASLNQVAPKLFAALAAEGPALISVYSGASGQAEALPPYLMSAAANEARAFPAIVYDPSAGPGQADRFCLSANPQADGGWSQHALDYQDSAYQRVEQKLAFTLVDLLACDGRYAGDFARVSPAAWNENMIPAGEAMDLPSGGVKVPCIMMLDADNGLHKVVANERLLRGARRCLDLWRGLQELGGIHNSHAERAVAREKAAWEEELKQREPVAAPAAAPAAGDAAAPVEAAAEPVKSPDEAYIETPRCSTCEECVRLNGKMFKYNNDKQAYIADINAGTYRQLVEAAESCQVSIIHPGKPKNPSEPGLDELMARAAPFM